MNRYERIKSLSTIKFGKKIPLYVEKGAVLDDLASGRNYLQLKLINLGKKNIKNLHISFLCKTYTDSTEELVELELKNIEVESKCSFGTKNLILLPINYKSIRFSEIIIEYADGEEACFASKRYFNISGSKQTRNSAWVPYTAALLLFLYDIHAIISSRDIYAIHGFYALIVLALLLRKKNVFLFLAFGVTGGYILFSDIARWITYMKYGITLDWRMIVPDILFVIVCILLCIFVIKKDKCFIRNIWFVPGIVHIVDLVILYWGYLSYYPSVYKIMIIAHVLSTFLIGYWVCQESKK